MHKELKRAIIMWLLDNEDEFQRVNVCRSVFRDYIYNSKGGYLIGGEDVNEFIKEVNKILYNEQLQEMKL